MTLLENNKVALVYGFGEAEQSIVSEILKGKYKVIDESMGKMKIGDILNGIKLEVYNCHLPSEKVVLFNNFEDEELKNTMRAIKASIQPSPIFAIVTDTSIDWTFEYLLEHLVEEREWYKKHGR
ncbi:DUF3783 domain-containing protein [Clostridium sp. CX1]|uniref:DUF3783 domain-containing protein n=1 Tax=Clostridium tanneri TaxID=3037988 RepID=A0ABU4JUK4_9CLOT|nr:MULTISPECIES: DUF3783 domain-containing protein [unclassified Clostridium]MCT8977515.1 DUF3783 domain-containing protein [Clostridium sp. CX1]MDW8801651.1 DUF3783 domain-containing protein [Clostridium sp. A1-XYC3]